MAFQVGDYVRYDGVEDGVYFGEGEVVGVDETTVHVRFDTFDYSTDGEDGLGDFHYILAKNLTLVERPGGSFESNVRRILDKIGDELVAKNQAYGDSALNPVRIFSKADRTEQLYVRLDDKLSRVARGHEYPGDDTLKDIVGYITLLMIDRETA